MIKILVVGLVIFILGALYALSNILVGRTDKAHTCGTGSCDTCALNTENCQEKKDRQKQPENKQKPDTPD